MTLIYCAATAVPFDDLDLQAQYGWPLYSCEDNFPVPFVMVWFVLIYILFLLFFVYCVRKIEQEGVVLDRPTKEELQWLTRLCEVLADR